nr:MAG TPA: hypothetical protein [Caudoviricetes sp.]
MSKFGRFWLYLSNEKGVIYQSTLKNRKYLLHY